MLSVLAYFVSKNFVEVLRAYESLPTHIMQLLQSLPPDSLAVRRELIIAARHFLSSALRNHFLPHIEVLLNENTLLGKWGGGGGGIGITVGFRCLLFVYCAVVWFCLVWCGVVL